MKLVDVHCHLESSLYEGKLDAIIADARRAGLAKLITASITPGEWELSRSLAERYPEVEFALGVHPVVHQGRRLRGNGHAPGSRDARRGSDRRGRAR